MDLIRICEDHLGDYTRLTTFRQEHLLRRDQYVKAPKILTSRCFWDSFKPGKAKAVIQNGLRHWILDKYFESAAGEYNTMSKYWPREPDKGVEDIQGSTLFGLLKDWSVVRRKDESKKGEPVVKAWKQLAQKDEVRNWKDPAHTLYDSYF